MEVVILSEPREKPWAEGTRPRWGADTHIHYSYALFLAQLKAEGTRPRWGADTQW
jgi:hypothetical protein